MSARPRLLTVVTGTGTEVGKTWVAAALARELVDAGWVVAARKPAQSFDPGDAGPRDADVLAAATGESADVVCPPHRNYETAMAPPMAADALGRPTFTVASLADEIIGSWSAHAVDVGIVELAGGWRSPQAFADESMGDDGAAMSRLLEPDVVVVVADAGLGTINAVRSVVAGMIARVVVVLNRFDVADVLHERNRRWLTDVDGFDVVTSVGSLAATIIGALGERCTGCGVVVGDGPGKCAGCRGPLDAPRFCSRCGRRLRVVVAPTTVTASCRLHGEL